MCRTLLDVTWRSKRPSAPVYVSFKLFPAFSFAFWPRAGTTSAIFRTPVPLVAFEAAGACVVTKVAASLAAREAMRTVRNSPNSGRFVQVSRVVASKQKKD